MKNAFLIVVLGLTAQVFGARIKDVSRLDGLIETQLIGYGLVVGLRGTGDGSRTLFTTQSIINMLRNMGIEVPKDRIQLRNVAAVMVTGKLSPFLNKGGRIDVTVSSIGDARSLEGGTLLMSPLQTAEGEMHAMAQGALSIGGFNKESSGGRSSVRKNHTLVGEIPNGAIVHKSASHAEIGKEALSLSLSEPDFSSAVSMAKAINGKYQQEIAFAEDAGTVKVTVPEAFKAKTMEFIAEMENVDFLVATTAKVILNEKTGTIIAGGSVSISEVAVSHGSITIEVTSNRQTTIQGAIAPGRAAQQTTRSENEDINVQEGKGEMKVLPSTSNVNELAKSLNSLGVSPRDVIAIFQAIKRAGALNAELIVM